MATPKILGVKTYITPGNDHISPTGRAQTRVWFSGFPRWGTLHPRKRTWLAGKSTIFHRKQPSSNGWFSIVILVFLYHQHFASLKIPSDEGEFFCGQNPRNLSVANVDVRHRWKRRWPIWIVGILGTRQDLSDVPTWSLNASPLKSYLRKRKVISQPSFLRGELLVSGRVSRLSMYEPSFLLLKILAMILLMEEILHQYGKYPIIHDGLHTPSQVGILAGFLPTIKTVNSRIHRIKIIYLHERLIFYGTCSKIVR